MDLVLLWLWYKLADAAQIQPPAWEIPYATGTALKREEKKKRRERDPKYANHKKELINLNVII